ncbi:MAG: Uncharacterized protein XD93_0607 [candidate division WS6 bacterium 34_10]|uniref:Transglutaminase-like domain-containing protein n=1 Tax=candidate division WS6 bacterium 34_10 TaxID=1641389 RepID=A0A101HHM3_9BACT|nr:MAG: Uncharacterized protein XD93_0607 [candidate division WS6 bacterium 34_10]
MLITGPKEQEINKYLNSGPQTHITEGIQKIVSGIEGTNLEKTKKILDLGSSLVERKGFDREVFRKRTASEILKDGFITGCTDAALLFVALARATNIPAKYVETIDEQWLKEGGDLIRGHVYSQIFDDITNKWIWVDPLNCQFDAPPIGRIIYKEGLDSWDIGIRDFDSLKKAFKEFRKQIELNNSR